MIGDCTGFSVVLGVLMILVVLLMLVLWKCLWQNMFCVNLLYCDKLRQNKSCVVRICWIVINVTIYVLYWGSQDRIGSLFFACFNRLSLLPAKVSGDRGSDLAFGKWRIWWSLLEKVIWLVNGEFDDREHLCDTVYSHGDGLCLGSRESCPETSTFINIWWHWLFWWWLVMVMLVVMLKGIVVFD